MSNPSTDPKAPELFTTPQRPAVASCGRYEPNILYPTESLQANIETDG